MLKMSSQDQQEETETLAYCVALGDGGQGESEVSPFSMFTSVFLFSDPAVTVGLERIFSESSGFSVIIFLLLLIERHEFSSQSTDFDSLIISLFSTSDPADFRSLSSSSSCVLKGSPSGLKGREEGVVGPLLLRKEEGVFLWLNMTSHVLVLAGRLTAGDCSLQMRGKPESVVILYNIPASLLSCLAIPLTFQSRVTGQAGDQDHRPNS